MNFDKEHSYESIFKSAVDGIIVIDENNKIRAFNPGAENLLGWKAEEVINQSLNIVIPERYIKGHNAGLKKFISTRKPKVIGLPVIELSSLHKDGHEIPTNFTISCWEENGQIFFTGILRDVTKLKDFENRQNLLIRELNHRVKNTLAVMNGIISQTARHSKSIKEFSESLESRIMAMSKTHDLLVDTNWSHTTLEKLLETFIEPYNFKYAYQGIPTNLKPSIAVMIGMGIQELVTNSIKYGAWSENGEVAINSYVDDDNIYFIWKERGGSMLTSPSHEGFGLHLLKNLLPRAVRGTAELLFEPDGLRYEVKVPLIYTKG